MASLAGRCVSTHLFVLRVCGFCKLHKTRPQLMRYFHEIFRKMSLTYTFTYIVQEFIYAYQVRHNMDLLARVMFLLLCHITSIAKQVVFHTRADDLEKLIDDFDDPLFNQEEDHAQSHLKQMVKNVTRLVKYYFSTAIVTCFLWIVFPVIDHYQGRHVEFFFWKHSLDSNKPVLFEAILLYSYILTTLVGVANTTMDAFMGTILYQTKTQLRILRLNLEKLPDKCWELKQTSSETYETLIAQEFLKCLEHYRKACKTTSDLEDIFGVAILIQFTIGGWILCMAAYKIVDLSLLSVEFASMFLFLFCILLELFLYCYYGNEASFESESLTSSIYTMDWLRTPVSFQKSLLILLERAKRPVKPAAGHVIPLSLDTFVTILRSSYTFYAVLRQTK